MNKMHSLARIVVVTMGLFFAVSLIEAVVMLVNTIIFMGSRGTSQSTRDVITALILSAFPVLCTGVLCYLCLCKYERIAEIIVGTNEPADPNSQMDWLPVAFRLACVMAGLYCLYTVFWGTLGYVYLYLSSKSQGFDLAQRFLNSESLLRYFVPLPIGIYLVCGAPHFVRWHVKKTREQCKLGWADTEDSK